MKLGFFFTTLLNRSNSHCNGAIRHSRMTERTSQLAGLWIGTAISNTSHSDKTGSTIAKRARLTGKGSSSTAMLSHKNKKIPYRPTCGVSLLSGHRFISRPYRPYNNCNIYKNYYKNELMKKSFNAERETGGRKALFCEAREKLY
jgi:hypothetical protein